MKKGEQLTLLPTDSLLICQSARREVQLPDERHASHPAQDQPSGGAQDGTPGRLQRRHTSSPPRAAGAELGHQGELSEEPLAPSFVSSRKTSKSARLPFWTDVRRTLHQRLDGLQRSARGHLPAAVRAQDDRHAN